jgi:hypothetical protein
MESPASIQRTLSPEAVEVTRFPPRPIVRGVCVLGLETGQTLRQRTLWRPLEWRMDALPFVDIPFQLLVVLSFTLLSLFCPSLENRAIKIQTYRAPLRVSEVDQKVRAVSPFFPSLSVLCQLRRAL